MDDNSMLIPQPELRFAEIVTRILQSQGFRPLSGAEPLMQKDHHTYQPEINYSRTRVFPTASAVSIYNRLEVLRQNGTRIPLVVVGGELALSVKAELLGVNSRALVLDIQNLLYMTAANRELYDELVSQLPYSVSGMMPQPPASVSGAEQNSASGNSSTSASGSLGYSKAPRSSGTSTKRWDDFSDFDSFDSAGHLLPSMPREPIALPGSSTDDRHHVTGSHGTGKTDTLRRLAQMQKDSDSGELRRELTQWQGGRGTALSIQYEKLCTKVLKQLFSNDLTLWQEQAKSNDELYRFDLICKIKRDNQKDFWEMAEQHFHSKYIIFEFKNYSGKVTQMEVTTTARYLYTKALRSIAIIVSPKGFSDHAEKAARGALREDGKLILALTNAELVKILQMQEDGIDPADYLSEKLDTLLINLEK